MITKHIFTALLTLTLYACATVEEPKPEPPKEKPLFEGATQKVELFFKCGVSDGAGRVFHATDSSKYIAEGMARRRCGLNSRHCVLLGCNETIENSE